MIVALENAFGEVWGEILSLVVIFAALACVPLLAWAATRLTDKIINRSVGK